MRIKAQTLPTRCEICHQSDCFDPVRNVCSRCAGIQELCDPITRAARTQVQQNEASRRRLRRGAWLLARESVLPILIFLTFPWWPGGFLLWVMLGRWMFLGLKVAFPGLQLPWKNRTTASAEPPAPSLPATVRSILVLSFLVGVVLVGSPLYRHLLNYQLLQACFKDDVTSAKVCVWAGADINVVHLYAWEAYFSYVEEQEGDPYSNFYTTSAQFRMRDIYDRTPLMIAAEQGSVPLVKALLDMGALVDERNLCFGRTAFMKAIAKEKLAVAQILLDHGANPDVQGRNQGRTALMTAVQKGNPTVIRFLLDRRADVTIKDKDRKTALDLLNPEAPAEIKEMLRERLAAARAQ